MVIYTFINIWKDPLQGEYLLSPYVCDQKCVQYYDYQYTPSEFSASLSKHLEGYDAGVMSGDTEYAISNLLQYALVASYGSGERLNELSSTIE